MLEFNSTEKRILLSNKKFQRLCFIYFLHLGFIVFSFAFFILKDEVNSKLILITFNIILKLFDTVFIHS